MSPTKKPAKPVAARDTSNEKWTKEELAAMKEHNRELKAAAANADGEQELLTKIAQLPAGDRSIAERLHAIVTSSAPSLAPRTYYGMPAWAKDGKVLVFFSPPRSSSRAIPRSASTIRRCSTTARCGRPRGR